MFYMKCLEIALLTLLILIKDIRRPLNNGIKKPIKPRQMLEETRRKKPYRLWYRRAKESEGKCVWRNDTLCGDSRSSMLKFIMNDYYIVKY
jgi:hypothetical protein